MVYFSFRRSIHEQTVEYQSVKQNHEQKRRNHSNASDWQICKNKQAFSDFSAISYCFVHIVMLIIIQMHFVLLTTISLLFVWEWHFWIILKKGRGLSPPPSARAYFRLMAEGLE